MAALHWTAYNSDLEATKYLLSKGAQMTYNIDDQTPLDVAGITKHTEVWISNFYLLTHFFS